MLQYPLETAETPGFVRFSPSDFSGADVAGEVIELYLPPGITFSDGAEYENFSAGAVGAAVLDIANANQKNATAASIASDFVSGSGVDIASSVAAKMAKIPLAPTELIQGGLRTADNPNTRVLFKSVRLRTFQFAFKMIPTSHEEALMIKAIVKEFRTQLYPETSGGSVGYKYPDMYNIELFHGLSGQKLSVPPKVKPSFLASVSTNLNSSSGAIFAVDGSSQYWSEVDITLEFFGGKTLDKNDIRGGY